MKYNYDILFDYACDKCYCVQTKDWYEYRGLLMNYHGGDIVLLTPNGIVHEEYKNIKVMRPIKKIPLELEEVLKLAELKESEKN